MSLLRKALLDLTADLIDTVVEIEEKELPKFRFDGEPITTAEELSLAMGIPVAEAKARIRRVRTQAGVRKYGQPLGSVITEDLVPHADMKFVPGKPSYWSRDTSLGGAVYNLNYDDRFDGKIARERQGVYRISARDKKTGVALRDYAYNFEHAKQKFEDWRDKILGSENTRRVKPASKKRLVDTKDSYWGVYGRDWSYGDGSEATLPEWDENSERTKRAWAIREVENLGSEWDGHALNSQFFHVANRVLEHHEEQYPGFMGLVTKVGTSLDSPNAFAFNKLEFQTRISSEGNEVSDFSAKKTSSVYWNAAWFAGANGDGALMSAEIQRSGQEGNEYKSHRYTELATQFPEYTDAQRGFMRTTVHELGHTVFRIVLGEFNSSEEDADEENRNYYRQMFWWDASTIMENHGLGSADEIYNVMAYETGSHAQAMALRSNVMKHVLSEYGGSSLHEMAAEVWAEYQLDSNPRQFAAEMGQLLEQVLEEYLYWNKGE